MKTNSLFLIPLLLLLSACRTHYETLIERFVEQDTVYQDRIVYDSVYISHTSLTDRTADTILIKENDTIVRYKLLHDSIREVRIDSIPYIVTITKREEIPRPRTLIDWLSYASLAILTILIYRKLRQKTGN